MTRIEPRSARADHLEQQLGTGLGERHEAEFVDYEEPVFRQLLLEAQQALLVPGLHHRVDQGGGGGKAECHCVCGAQHHAGGGGTNKHSITCK